MSSFVLGHASKVSIVLENGMEIELGNAVISQLEIGNDMLEHRSIGGMAYRIPASQTFTMTIEAGSMLIRDTDETQQSPEKEALKALVRMIRFGGRNGSQNDQDED